MKNYLKLRKMKEARLSEEYNVHGFLWLYSGCVIFENGKLFLDSSGTLKLYKLKLNNTYVKLKLINSKYFGFDFKIVLFNLFVYKMSVPDESINLHV